MTGLFSELFLKIFWKHKEIDDHNNSVIKIGIFYRPIDFIIESCHRMYELRLPRYDLNDTFPLDENGYTKITHSLLLEHGRYYANGPLLFENIKDLKLKSKTKSSLILHIDMYRSKGHIVGITIRNSENVVLDNIRVVAHWK